uniref:Uncharacterized protein n=1 Tax=Apteryx owenii TaxID=8824 RepID=A0A8B9QBJ2_APTOW
MSFPVALPSPKPSLERQPCPARPESPGRRAGSAWPQGCGLHLRPWSPQPSAGPVAFGGRELIRGGCRHGGARGRRIAPTEAGAPGPRRLRGLAGESTLLSGLLRAIPADSILNSCFKWPVLSPAGCSLLDIPAFQNFRRCSRCASRVAPRRAFSPAPNSYRHPPPQPPRSLQALLGLSHCNPPGVAEPAAFPGNRRFW